MDDYNKINARWARIDTLLRQNPFGENALESPALIMAYTASYNTDTFRRFVFDTRDLFRRRRPTDFDTLGVLFVG